ncbi:type II toxin-antitoxin system VapC family toxin [Frankia sp. AgKG'84/4]|uniref:type II toxin-antitoxin system VapC family toxin n=1 Tax=Frankia sp. AgKG'84/4 TaxID=573490 RepID=UPI00200F5C28|nr:type II toxin-antitoxin system VapC family toxin [Frankia sp. AgKG'84/4]MCL9792985.1 type II toxin-antitoxin system VapC family toxin [Frankia sp. AgKG'84/4]
MSRSEAVIDCSALVRTLTDHSPAGQAVRRRLEGLASLAAPGLLDYELVSALFGMVRGHKLSRPEAEKAVEDYRRLPLVRHETLVLWPRVRDLHHNLSAYDAQYVALAEALRLPLITSDARIECGGVARCPVEVFA